MLPMVSTIPKSGTHLLWNILELDRNASKIKDFKIVFDPMAFGYWSQRWRQFENGISGHIYHTTEMARLFQINCGIFLRRHPADVLVSWLHYLPKARAETFLFPMLREFELDIMKSDDRLDFLIENTPALFIQFLKWMDEPIHLLRFEDLITKPREVLAPVAKDLGMDLDLMVERSKIRESHTFRKGDIGDWKKEFQPHHIEKFTKNFAEIMEVLEY